jgi:hypothetical protein
MLLTVSIAGALWLNQQAVADACPDQWWNSTDPAVLTSCGEEKARRTDADRDEEYRRKLAELYYQTIPGSFPAVLLPQPEDTKLIQQIPLDSPVPQERQARPVHWIGATSLWQAGSVPNATYTSWDGLHVITHAGNGAQYPRRGAPGYWINNENPTLSTYVANGDEFQRTRYSLRWTSPRPLGSIYITNIVSGGNTLGIGADPPNFVGLNYTVYFNSPMMNISGSFNMATQVWTFTP